MGSDLRTTAFLQPARKPYWTRPASGSALAPARRTPCKSCASWMQAATEPEARMVIRDFNAAEDFGRAPLAGNLPNWLLRREMLARLASAAQRRSAPWRRDNRSLHPHRHERVVSRSATVQPHLNANLVIAADGRNSPMREAAGIAVHTTLRYGQKALAFAVTHPIPHENVSTEIHRSGGPFTLGPLAGLPGQTLVSPGLDGARAPRAQELFEHGCPRLRGRNDRGAVAASSAR